MIASCRNRWFFWAALAAAGAVAGPGWAADALKGAGKVNPKDETVEIFAGMASGMLEAKVVAKDAAQCQVLITNKTDRPLNVALPDAFACAPVLAQFGFPGQPRQGPMPGPGNPQKKQDAPQVLGAGNPMQMLNPMQNPGGQQFMNVQQPRAFFNIAPEKVAQLKVATVCLEHGKPEPKPQIAYELKPLEKVSAQPGVRELCVMLARGDVSQEGAQAAAWHLNNGLSWDQLKGERIKFVFTATSKPLFTRRQLDEGKKAAEKALEQARNATAATAASESGK